MTQQPGATSEDSQTRPAGGPNLFKRCREDWLRAAAYDHLAPLFFKLGFPFPLNVRFACGFPSGDGNIVIGQCWAAEASADGNFEIFVSPRVSQPVAVLGVLTHEMVHAAVGIPAGHAGSFVGCAKKLGLVGPMTATIPGPILGDRLRAIAQALGPYAHAELHGRFRPFRLPTWPEPEGGDPRRRRWPCGTKRDPNKKQSTRLIKIVCPLCGWPSYASQQRINERLPLCDCHGSDGLARFVVATRPGDEGTNGQATR